MTTQTGVVLAPTPSSGSTRRSLSELLGIGAFLALLVGSALLVAGGGTPTSFGALGVVFTTFVVGSVALAARAKWERGRWQVVHDANVAAVERHYGVTFESRPTEWSIAPKLTKVLAGPDRVPTFVTVELSVRNLPVRRITLFGTAGTEYSA